MEAAPQALAALLPDTPRRHAIIGIRQANPVTGGVTENAYIGVDNGLIKSPGPVASNRLAAQYSRIEGDKEHLQRSSR
jgi:hypothetical protein